VSLMEFIAAMTSALVWPILVGLAVVLFQRELRLWLAERPTKMKVGPVEAEWPRVLSHVERDLEQAGVPPPTELAVAGQLSDHLAEVSESSPMVAITEAVDAVDRRLRQGLSQASIAAPEQLGLTRLARLAREHGLIRPETEEAVAGLAVMRNLAVHGRAVSTQQARDFLALADGVLFALDRDLRQ